MEIIKGKIKKPLKVLIYGQEGIGKSTLAANFPDPIFIDTEGSTAELDLEHGRMIPTSYQMLLEQVGWLTVNHQQEGIKTLIIDTADWAEKMIREKVIQENSAKGIKGIEDFGYGKGFTFVWEDFGRLITALDRANASGLHVVLTAHAAIRKFEQPDEAGSYDRWELKLQNSPKANICAMVKEWADMVLFCAYETTVYKTSKEEGKKTKAVGGGRVIHTAHHPCWDAKNRHGLAEKLPLSYESIRAVVEGHTPNAPEAPQKAQERKETNIPQEIPGAGIDALPFEITDTEPEPNLPRALLDLMAVNRVTAKELKAAVVYRGYFPETLEPENYPQDFIEGCLIAAWPQVFEIIQSIHEQGTTILLVEQNAEMALRIADRAYVLETGTIAMSGPASVLANDDRVRKAYLGG